MNYTDEAIIQAIKENNENLDECFKYLYKTALNKAVHFFTKKGLNENEIKDLFQEAVIVFYEAVKEERYVATAKITTYLFSIMNKMWINIIKKKKADLTIKDITNVENFEKTIEEKLITKEKRKNVLFFINQLNKDCKRILVYFYYHKLPMREIAKELGYKNDQIARNKKVKCMKALQDIIKNNRLETDLKE